MRMIGLFSGIGGFEYAAQQVWGDELEIVCMIENAKFAQKVLKKNFPGTTILGDIKDVSARDFRAINLLTGGFPCQPFSVAGKRKGTDDDRAIWKEMFRIITECHPGWIIAENVHGIISMELDSVLSDLESEGYEVQTFVIPAVAVDAPHKRDRVWIVANSGRKHGTREKERREHQKQNRTQNAIEFERSTKCSKQGIVTDSTNARLEGLHKPEKCSHYAEWSIEPELDRVAYGIPNRVDRLKGLGNAIVPQVAMVLMSFIKETDEKLRKDR